MGRPRGSTNKKSQEKQEQFAIENASWGKFAEDSFIGNSVSMSTRTTSTTKINKEELDRILQNPKANYSKLQDLSQYLENTNGIYKRLLKYIPYILTYDFELIPKTESSKFMDKSNYEKAYDKNALYLEKMKLKSNLPEIAYNLFKNGEHYIYKVQSSDDTIVYKQIPNKYCLPYQNINDVFTFVIDMPLFISREQIETYPDEIYNACLYYKENSKDSLFLEQRWYKVSENGVCFNLNKEGLHGTPSFMNVFKDLLNIDDSKVLQKQVDKLNNTKMIHNQVPLDKENRPILNATVCKEYNKAIKSNLEDGIFSIVNPFDAQVLTLNDSTQKATTLSHDAINGFFDNVGVSDMLFNNNKASSEALKKSVITDSILAINELLPMFESYVNKELSDNMSGTIKFMIKLHDFTYFDREEKRKMALAEAGYGGNPNLFLATCGYTPLQAINALRGADLLGIRELMKPLLSSHTTSGKELTDNGAPKKVDGVSDNTEKSLDQGN